MGSAISDKDYALFHRFWAFEYGKRNQSFRHAIENIFRTNDPDEKRTHKATLASWGYSGWIASYCEQWRNKQNVLDMIDKNLALQFPEEPMFQDTGVDLIEYNGTDRVIESLSERGPSLPPGYALIKVNFSQSLKSITEDIEGLYKRYHGSNVHQWTLDMEYLLRGHALGLKRDKYAVERRAAESVKGISFEIDHIPRAVGLWIWDFVDNKWGMHPPSKQTGFLSEAMNTLKKTSPTVRSRYGASKHQTFSKLYNRTMACIESVKVMTFQ